MRPVNIASKNAYRGVNILTLWATADEKGYSSGTWGTYKQWAEAGAQVRKGEKSAYIVFYKEITVAATTEQRRGRHPAFRPRDARLRRRAGRWLRGSRHRDARNRHPADRAGRGFCRRDRMRLSPTAAAAPSIAPRPTASNFPRARPSSASPTSTPAEAYYSTLLHELTHWTGHETRCNRQLGKRFGDDAYAMEELVAELGAAFLCADLGITDAPRADHAQYLDHWLTVMKADKKAIFTAASKASEAVTFLASLQGA